jgi:DHA1 family multidrug resistance protein-like MFS transporter
MNAFDRKTFATLSFSVFATAIGVGIVVPLLPIYAHELGASGLEIGLIFGAFALSRTVFLPLFGRLSDTKGRRTFIVPGLLLYALISLAFTFSTDVNGLIVIRLFHGIASAMLMPVIQAYVADITPPGREGRMMGLYSMFVLFGLSVGPLMGGLSKDLFGLKSSFLAMGLFALVGFFMCVTWLPPVRSEPAAASTREPIPWKELLGDRTLSGLFTVRFAYVVCIGIIWGFVPLYASIEFPLSGASIGALITVGIVVSGSLNAPMGYLADRIDKRLMVAVGGLLAGYAMLSFQWATSYTDMIVASVLFGLGGGTGMPAVMAMAARRGQGSDAMGSVMALMTMAHSLGMLTGALLGGVMMDLYQLRFVFPAGSAVMASGVVFFLLLTLKSGSTARPAR